MAKLILYSPYYKATDFRMGKYVRYIATREGVELPKNTKLKSPATKKQKDLIENMLKDFPNCNELLEYKDYLDKPTIENANPMMASWITEIIDEQQVREVKYLNKRELETAINELYGGEELSEEEIQAALAKAAQFHGPRRPLTEQEIERNKAKKKSKSKESKGGGQSIAKNNVPIPKMNNVK